MGAGEEERFRRENDSSIATSSFCVLMAQNTKGVTIFFAREGDFIALTPCPVPGHFER